MQYAQSHRILMIALTVSLSEVAGCATDTGKTAIPNTEAKEEYLLPPLMDVINLELAQKDLKSTTYSSPSLPVLPIPASMKMVVLAQEQIQSTFNSLAPEQLAQCQFLGVKVELDDNLKTSEWLFTTDNVCTHLKVNQNKPFWVLSQVNNDKPRVLIADRAFQVRIWQQETGNAMRRVAVMTKATAPSHYTKQPMDVQCHASWVNKNGTYQRVREFVEVYREDPMSKGKNWEVVEGQDPYAAVDSRFECN
jgi:hypothetical protein